MHIYTYAKIKNCRMYIYTKKKVIEVKNDAKRNFLVRNDGVTLRTDS